MPFNVNFLKRFIILSPLLLTTVSTVSEAALVSPLSQERTTTASASVTTNSNGGYSSNPADGVAVGFNEFNSDTTALANGTINYCTRSGCSPVSAGTAQATGVQHSAFLSDSISGSGSASWNASVGLPTISVLGSSGASSSLSFHFNLLQDASYTLTGDLAYSTALPSAIYQSSSAALTFSGSSLVTEHVVDYALVGPSTVSFNDSGILSAGQYYVTVSATSGGSVWDSFNAYYSANASYSFDLAFAPTATEVTAVPIPGALGLFASALGMLAMGSGRAMRQKAS